MFQPRDIKAAMTEFSVAGARVVVVGAARSGVAAARLLATRGAQVVLTEQRRNVGESVTGLQGLGVELELGGHGAQTLDSADLVVLSPGVLPTVAVLDEVRRRRVPIISEIELASRWLQGRIVAVTGTKGKSTTVELIGRMLEAGGSVVLVGGNIGTALSSQVEASTPDMIHVVEVSSFQLELTRTFRPTIAVLLNLHSDHLDRHESYTAYLAAKTRIFANQTASDTLVVNADDPEVLRLTRSSQGRRVAYALTEPIDTGVVVTGDVIVRRSETGEEKLVPLSAVRLLGSHQLSNVLAASTVADLVGVSPRDMTVAVDRFPGLEHVLEPVGEVAGVRFVNDSKATNIEAARRAVESCGDHLVVIMGGRFKGGAFESLQGVFESRADAVIVLGEARERIHEGLGPVVRIVDAVSLHEAVRVAYGLAVPGGTVLLAPGCASLDMFQDYAERGRVFRQAVDGLKEEIEEKREQ